MKTVIGLLFFLSFGANSATISDQLRGELASAAENAEAVLHEFRGGSCASALLPQSVRLSVVEGGTMFAVVSPEYTFKKSATGFFFYHRYNHGTTTKQDNLIVVAPLAIHAQVIAEFEADLAARFPDLEIRVQSVRGDGVSSIHIDNQTDSRGHALNLAGVGLSLIGEPDVLDLAVAYLTEN